jgi:hypothetical protein
MNSANMSPSSTEMPRGWAVSSKTFSLMTQIQSGGVPLEFGEVILNDLIARSGEAAKPFAASKEIELRSTSSRCRNQGRPRAARQVLDNLYRTQQVHAERWCHPSHDDAHR